MNVIPDFFKDDGAGLSSVKYTCAGYDIVAAAAGVGCVDVAAGDRSIAAAAASGGGSVAADAGGGSISDAAGDVIAVGCTGFSCILGTGADVALLLYPLHFLLL